ncbi:MAG: hypothetical protein E7016_01050 [Alphaproteobacteria bacterium]|nr:hypothetical protein [Alphaproteobacteria bacterium]
MCNHSIIVTMFTTFCVIVGAVATSIGLVCVTSDGKDHTQETIDYEDKYPYSTRELTEPYNP